MLLNADRAVKIMERLGLDALVTSSPHNINYVSDIRHENRTRVLMFAVLLRSNWRDSVLLMPLGDMRDVAGTDHTWIKDLRPTGKFLVYKEKDAEMDPRETDIWKVVLRPKLDSIDALVQTLDEKGLRGKRVGLDESWLMKSVYDLIQSKVERNLGTRVESGFSAFREIRMVKTEEEVRRLRISAKITEEAIAAALDVAKEGASGEEIVRSYMRKAWEMGAYPTNEGIGFGRLAFLNNRQKPSRHRLKRGDLIRFDASLVYESYYSDVARTAILGEPTTKQKRIYEAVKVGNDAAMELVRPGVKVSQVFKAAVEGTRNAGIPEFDRSHCGHGIGIELYDDPLIDPTDEAVFEENMVIDIENPYYSIGFGAAHVEDTILVLSKGHERLTTSSRDLLVL